MKLLKECFKSKINIKNQFIEIGQKYKIHHNEHWEIAME